MESYERWIIQNWRWCKIVGLSMVIFMLIFLIIGLFKIISFPVYISGAFSIFLGVFIYHLGVSAEFFSKLITIFGDEIKIKWLTATVIVKDTYITYFSAVNPYSFWIIFKDFIPHEEIPPEHFQIWRSTSWPVTLSESPIDHRGYLLESTGLSWFCKKSESSEKPKEWINKGLILYLPEHIPELPHLTCIELARWKNKNIILAFLGENASINEFTSVFHLLDQIEKNIAEDT